MPGANTGGCTAVSLEGGGEHPNGGSNAVSSFTTFVIPEFETEWHMKEYCGIPHSTDCDGKW